MTTSFCFDFALSSQLRRIKRISAMRQRPSSISASRLNHLAQVAISVGTSANSVKPSKILRSAAFLTVLKKALETDDLSIERKEDKVCFPWFTDHGIDGEMNAYMQLVSGIAKRAKMLTRVTATESPSDNDKFTMRLFLVSLNFKGPEYAFARKFFLRNLSGNSGWRTEEAKARHDARKVRTEIEALEVTIGHVTIEGGEADAGISE